jgi:hypothetical protein
LSFLGFFDDLPGAAAIAQLAFGSLLMCRCTPSIAEEVTTDAVREASLAAAFLR